MHNMLYPICSFEGSGVYASSITSQFRVAGKIRSASGEVSAFQGAFCSGDMDVPSILLLTQLKRFFHGQTTAYSKAAVETIREGPSEPSTAEAPVPECESIYFPYQASVSSRRRPPAKRSLWTKDSVTPRLTCMSFDGSILLPDGIWPQWLQPRHCPLRRL
jgi:hypothetical protein